MTEEIQRYTFGFAPTEGEFGWFPCKFGEAVKATDHFAAMSRAEAERDALKAQVERQDEIFKARAAAPAPSQPHPWHNYMKEHGAEEYAAQNIYQEGSGTIHAPQCAPAHASIAVPSATAGQSTMRELKQETAQGRKRGVMTLIQAACEGNLAEVNRLIAAGADAKAVDRYGTTALMYAAAFGYSDCIASLLPYSDVTSVDSYDMTALMYAETEDYMECIALLEAAERKEAVNDRNLRNSSCR